ncbi:predicted protein [Sclerotinia sclerotiorum 1980 UF-70]|uniref:Uncharacterized protein n=1 Tax=Sclerotinia sclerotiorum (strain ATCC 18683 / 1980 / Ss-1) TaxID=665079 RepID=A7EDW1_SCLS1|nr:predicted protein [Sclerotinia sclerotiorum 1980 UF-70]EDO01027.1 predicted protein [Sclerotinia sclerotiorum 1980 UF-70]
MSHRQYKEEPGVNVVNNEHKSQGALLWIRLQGQASLHTTSKQGSMASIIFQNIKLSWTRAIVDS